VKEETFATVEKAEAEDVVPEEGKHGDEQDINVEAHETGAGLAGGDEELGAEGAVAVHVLEVALEGIIVLGKVVEGTLAADLEVGMEMELTTMPLYTDEDGFVRTVHAWRIAS